MAAGARRPVPAWLPALLPLLAWAPCRAVQLAWPDAPPAHGGHADAALTPQEVEAVLQRLDAEAEADEAESDQRLTRLFAAGASRTWKLPDEGWAGGPPNSPEEAMGEEADGGAQRSPEEAMREEEGPPESPQEAMGPMESPEEAMNEEEVDRGPARSMLIGPPAREAGAHRGLEKSPEEAMHEQAEQKQPPPGMQPRPAARPLVGPAGATAGAARDEGLAKSPEEAMHEEEADHGQRGGGLERQQGALAAAAGSPAGAPEEAKSPEEAMHEEEGKKAAPSSPEEAMHQEEGAPAESATALACSSAFSGYDAVCDGLEWARGQCSFVVATRGASCSDYCKEQGSECLAAADNKGNDCTVNPDPQGRGGAPTTASFCLARFSSQICVCRTVGPGAGPPAPAARSGAIAAPWAEDDRVRAEVDRAVREAERAEQELQELETEARRGEADREAKQAGEARSAAEDLRRLERAGGGGDEPLLEDEGGAPAPAAVRGATEEEEEPQPQPPHGTEFRAYGHAGGECLTREEPLFAGRSPGRAGCEDRCAINPLCRFYSYGEESQQCRLTIQCNGTAQPTGPPATVYYRHDDSEQAAAIEKSLWELAGSPSAGGPARGGEGRAAAATAEATEGARGRANRTFEKLKSVGQALGAMDVVPRVSEGAWDKLGTIWGEMSEALAIAHKEREVGSLVAELRDMLGREQEEGAPSAKRRGEATAPAADVRRLAP